MTWSSATQARLGVIVVVMVASMVLSVAPAVAGPSAGPPPSSPTATEGVADPGCFVRRCVPTDSRRALEAMFHRMLQVPDDVLRRGDAATDEWVRAHSPSQREGNALGCIGAVGAVLVGVLVPAVKILKIKALIKDLGGVVAATRLLIGAGTAAEKAEAVVTALAALVAELSGIAGIQRHCFS